MPLSILKLVAETLSSSISSSNESRMLFSLVKRAETNAGGSVSTVYVPETEISSNHIFAAFVTVYLQARPKYLDAEYVKSVVSPSRVYVPSSFMSV